MTQHKFGDRIRLHYDDLFREYVVTPKGRIKTAYYERNVQPAMLRIGRTGQVDGRVERIDGVSIPPDMAKLGYVLLRDLYEAEERMDDWATFLIYQQQCRQYGRHVSDPISDDYLPEEVLERRKKAAMVEGKPELPPAQTRKPKAPKAAKRKAPAGKSARAKLHGNGEIIRRKVPAAWLMGRKDAAHLLQLADDRDALADGVFQ